MARRDIEKILNELGEVRRVLDDPAVGLAAFHQDQDELRRKVLENIQLGTTGLREENRELRRRQEKMLSDLSDTRAAVEALRREIAQAWAHTISASNAAAVPGGATAELAQREQRVLEAGTDGGGEAGREEAVDEGTEPAEHDGNAPREEQGQGEVPAAPSAEQKPPPPASASASDAPTTEAAAAPTDESEEDWEKVDYRRHMDSVLKAGAIASARLVCHRDTWTFVIEQTSQHPHFRHPDCVSALEDGRIETFLSGRSLLAVMVTMRKILDDRVAGDPEMATWALANAVYQRTQMAVADAKHTRPDGAEVTTIVLDDRPVPADAS